jgi:hypothetical protein
MPSARLTLAAIVCSVGGSVGLISASAQAPADSSRLFPRPYVSTAVLENGKSHPDFNGGEVRVDFVHGPDYDIVQFDARCNFFGGRLEIAGHHLAVSEITQTLQLCWGVPNRREGWVRRFFGGDPRWHSSGLNKLTLVNDDRVIKLRRDLGR